MITKYFLTLFRIIIDTLPQRYLTQRSGRAQCLYRMQAEARMPWKALQVLQQEAEGGAALVAGFIVATAS